MNPTIHVTLKDVYGRTRIYPACDQAQRLADIAGDKTLTVSTLKIARDMGFELVYVDRFGIKQQGPEATRMLLSLAA